VQKVQKKNRSYRVPVCRDIAGAIPLVRLFRARNSTDKNSLTTMIGGETKISY
jgi:hypothetical protein